MTSKAESIDVGEPALPRRRNAPMRFGGGLCEGDFTETAKDLNRQEYFEANNTIVACIQDQFDQHGHIILRTLESLLMKSCKKEHHDEDLDVICNLYHSDFDKEQIIVQLQLLGASFNVVPADGAMNIFHVKEYFLSLSKGQRLLMSQVAALLQFILIIPATNDREIDQCATTSQKLLAHDDAAGTYELSDVAARSQGGSRRSGHASSVDRIHWRVLLDLLAAIGLFLCQVLCYLKGYKVSRLLG